jgi:spore germination protein
MDIYVVQAGDTINSIADRFGVSRDKLIQDNGLTNPMSLVPGQTIVITYPLQTHTVKEGDTLVSISELYGVTLMQLLRNNSFLNNREYFFPGETLVISYQTNRDLATVGYAYPYMNKDTLRRTLPYLTYLSVYNYQATAQGEIISHSDDSEMIRLAKEYDTIPLALMTTLTPQGQQDLLVAYDMLLNEEYQDIQLNNLVNIVKEKGYMGANFLFNLINKENIGLYERFTEKVSNRFVQEDLIVFVTINMDINNTDDEVNFERIDYSGINRLVDGAVFLQFVWGTNYGPPSPVSSITNERIFVDYAVSVVSPDKFLIGQPVIAYDWTLPYVQGKQGASSLTLDAAISLAGDVGATIQLDERSVTPNFNYSMISLGTQVEHVVWSIDARTILSLSKLISDYNLIGLGIWNIMAFEQQIWTVIISNFDIVKLLPKQ